jgi:hypothetical protein
MHPGTLYPQRRSLWMLVLMTAGLLLSVTGLAQEGDPDKKKRPVPSADEQAKTEKLIRTLFKQEYAQAEKDAQAKLKLVEFLLQSARETNDDPVARFVLLREGRDLAAEAGEVGQALAVLDEMTREFVLPALETKAALLARGAKAATGEKANALVEIALDALDEALEADHFKVAGDIMKAAQAAIAKMKNLALAGQVQQRAEELASIQKEHVRIQEFVDKLKKDAKEPAANLQVGKYYGLLRGNWLRALPHLALSSDETLKDLAQKDLARPKTAKAQLALGDAWWHVAEQEKGLAQLRLRQRAAYWYEEALPDLTGINRTRIEKRLAEASLEGEAGPNPEGKVGEVHRLEGYKDIVWTVAYSPNGRHILAAGGGDLIDGNWVAGSDYAVRLWNARTGKEVKRIPNKGGVATIVISADGRQAFWSSGELIRVWDLKSGKELKSFENAPQGSLSLSANGQRLLTGGWDKTVRLWDVPTRKELRRFVGHTGRVWCVALSPDGKRAASCGDETIVRVWDTQTGKELRQLQGHTESAVAVTFSPDGKRLLSGGWDNTARVWKVETGEELHCLRGHEGRVEGVAWSRDGKRLLTGSLDKTARLWDAASGKELYRCEGHTSSVSKVAFSPDGRFAVSGGWDHTARLWRLPK